MSLLLDLIGDLNPEEQKAAANWLHCPTHNHREDVNRLFSFYLQTPAETQENIHAWTYCFGTQDYNHQQFRLLQSYLLRRLEDWLSYTEWASKRGDSPSGIELIKAYQRRGLSRHLNNRLHRRRKALKKRPAAHPDELMLEYALESVHFDLAARDNRLETHNLSDLQMSLDAAIIALKLRSVCQALSSRRLTGQEVDIFLMDACLQAAAQEPYAELPAIKPFYLACQLLLHDSDVDFAAFRDNLFAQIDNYTIAEQQDLLFIAINHCVGRINSGAAPYMQEAFALYRLGIEKALLYDHGRLTNYTFNNIVGIGLRLSEEEWVGEFLRNHENRLPEKGGQEVYALNAARHAYYKQDYQEALVYLRSADYRDFIHHLSARTLQFKVYWELGYHHLMNSHLKNTRALLNRRKKSISSYHITNYRNFFALANRLFRLPPGDESARQKMLADLETTDPLTERIWFIDQLR